MEPKDPIVWRIICANVAAWIGAFGGAVVAPESPVVGYGYAPELDVLVDVMNIMVGALYAVIGAFLGALFGCGVGWFIDRRNGDGQRQGSYSPPRLDNRTGPRPGETVNSGVQPNRANPPAPQPSEPGGSGSLPNRANPPAPRPSEPSGGRPIRLARPDSVSAVTAVHHGDTIAVSWAEVESAIGYDVRYTTNYSRSWTSAASGQIGTSFVLTGARMSETYTFAVRAVNDAGASGWATSAPAAP